MRVYLDVCAIQRPLDTPNQIRIVLEAEAVLGIIALCEAERLEIVSSDALIYETEQNPLPVRREHARAVLQKARETIKLSEEIKARATQLVKSGFKSLDALHLALAEAGRVGYFCTCDDRLLRRAQRVDLRIKVVSPLALVQEIEK
ncbi:MAG: type II toxin-antitoxin system VapC family toxin [Chloroflexi bacterium]|nr:type II toxin-antitoxin system VapC family toxin [Chloroflexota bacterium]